MRYIRLEDERAARVVKRGGSISVTGSVRGMQKQYGWQRGGQVRIGAYIYDVGPSEVARLRSSGYLRGE